TGPATPSGAAQGLGNAALDGSYAMVMRLVEYRNGPQLKDLWGADEAHRQIGRVWPSENWLFTSRCYPQACETDLTVEGRGKRAWDLAKDGREYSGTTPGAGCKGAVVSRSVHLTVSQADVVNAVLTATHVEGRLTIEVTC